MYCELCRIDTGPTCHLCGQALLAPGISQASANDEQSGTQPFLWNPDVAALLSWLFLTVVFGALVHAANWQRLGQTRRMWGSLAWAGVYLGALTTIGVAARVHLKPDQAYLLLALAHFPILAAWYFTSGRAQSKLIVVQMKNKYRRESWFIPIALALGVIVAFRFFGRALF